MNKTLVKKSRRLLQILFLALVLTSCSAYNDSIQVQEYTVTDTYAVSSETQAHEPESPVSNYYTDEYLESDYADEEYFESDYIDEEYFESDYIDEEYFESDYIDEEYFESDYIDEEYSDSSYYAGEEVQYFYPALPMVIFPPPERILCSICNGTLKSVCIKCDGSGKANDGNLDEDLYSAFGLGRLARTLNELTCILCDGSGEMECGFGYCDGTMVNSEYRQYCLGLKELSDQTGVRIFELESNQISPYISLDFCTMCDGLGWLPQLKVHETHTPLCSKCYAQGMKLEFVDSFTEDELIRSYDNYLAYHPINQYGNSDSGSWYEAPEDTIWTTSGLNDGRGTIDLGAESTGNCPGCGAKVYTSDTYCAFCR